ncbi:TonB family protein [Roseateles sp.]|uniref:TonB family protein n=1 Tax=Roseateles sp. TaxID=1971397 RepID=UPI003BADAD27
MRFADAPARKAAARRRGPARALLASLLVHALLLSLAFGGDGAGLPGLNLPWQQRRAEVPDLRVVLLPAAPGPSQPPPASPAPPGAPDLPPDMPAAAGAATDASARAEPAPVAEAAPLRMAAAEAVATATPAVIAVDRPARPTWTVPPALPASTPVIAVFGQDAASAPPAMAPLRNASDAMRMRADRERAADLARLDLSSEDVRQQAQRLEAVRAEAERLEAERLEAARTAALQEAARQEAARAQAERQDAARRAAAQQEATRQEALRQDAARQEAARAEAARQEAARQDAAKQEAARQDAARSETTRQEAARVATAKLDAARAAEEQREARLRAIGRQLDEEAARRDAAASRPPNAALPTSWSSARRGRLLGRIDTNAELVAYAEAWARKIQFNPTFDTVRDALKQPYTDPLVNVAIRSDGSVESVTFVRSSGVPALDDAVRRVIQSQERYAAFPPALLQDYDVIEIRRTWHFDSAIRLY